MLYDSTSTLIDGLVSSSSSISSQFPPQSSSFNRKRVTPQVNTPTPKRKMWEYLRVIIRPVPAMLTVLLRSEPVTFDTILSACSWDTTRKTHQHVPSDHWKCKNKTHQNKKMWLPQGQDTNSTALRRVEGHGVLLRAIVVCLSPPATLLSPPATAQGRKEKCASRTDDREKIGCGLNMVVLTATAYTKAWREHTRSRTAPEPWWPSVCGLLRPRRASLRAHTSSPQSLGGTCSRDGRQ